jgi:hypothetical protein
MTLFALGAEGAALLGIEREHQSSGTEAAVHVQWVASDVPAGILFAPRESE